MKRYTKEFINDELRTAKECGMETRAAELGKIYNVLNKGRITDYEAIRLVVETIEKHVM